LDDPIALRFITMQKTIFFMKIELNFFLSF